MKTKEQQAEEYAKTKTPCLVPDAEIYNTADDLNKYCVVDFIAGYEAAQRWILISEEPRPIKDSIYSEDVILTDGDSTEIGFYSFKSKQWIVYGNDEFKDHFKSTKSTHWLPIPKLPTK